MASDNEAPPGAEQSAASPSKVDQRRVEAARKAAEHIASARERVRKAAERDKRCLVAVSGGKDSLVTLDLCCEAFDHVEGFYLYLVPGLQTFEAPVDAAARRHGIKMHKMPHFDLARLIKYAVLRPHVPNAHEIRELRWIDVNNTMRAQTGIQWIAAGERATDSIQRRFYTRQFDGVQWHLKRFFPIWDWVDSDVYGYLRARRIPVPSIGDYSRSRGSGFSLDGRGLAWLKRTNPGDFAKVLKVFPYAEAEVIRYERNRELAAAAGPELAERVPKLRRRKGASKRVEERAVQPEAEAEPAQEAEA